jgi:hypothetical protein
MEYLTKIWKGTLLLKIIGAEICSLVNILILRNWAASEVSFICSVFMTMILMAHLGLDPFKKGDWSAILVCFGIGMLISTAYMA